MKDFSYKFFISTSKKIIKIVSNINMLQLIYLKCSWWITSSLSTYVNTYPGRQLIVYREDGMSNLKNEIKLTKIYKINLQSSDQRSIAYRIIIIYYLMHINFFILDVAHFELVYQKLTQYLVARSFWINRYIIIWHKIWITC